MIRIAVFVFFLCATGTLWGLSIGERAPLFSLAEIRDSSQVVELEAYRGRVVYVDFWASWCGPCIESFPALSELHEKYRDQGFEVIAINMDEDTQDALHFVEEHPADYLLVAGYGTDVAERYELLGMPTGYFIDTSGRVQLVHQGFQEHHQPFLEAVLLRLLTDK